MGFELKQFGDIVPVGGSEPAVPPLAYVGILGAQGQGEAGEAGGAAEQRNRDRSSGGEGEVFNDLLMSLHQTVAPGVTWPTRVRTVDPAPLLVQRRLRGSAAISGVRWAAAYPWVAPSPRRGWRTERSRSRTETEPLTHSCWRRVR